MSISGVTSGSGVFQNPQQTSRQEQIRQRSDQMRSALQSAQTPAIPKNDVVQLLNNISTVFEPGTGSKIPKVSQALNQFSVVLDHVDPGVLEGLAEDFVRIRRRFRQPSGTAFVNALNTTASELESHVVPTSLAYHISQSPHTGTSSTFLPHILAPLRTDTFRLDPRAQEALASLSVAEAMNADEEFFQEQYDSNIEEAQAGDMEAVLLVVQASVALGIDPELEDHVVKEALDQLLPSNAIGLFRETESFHVPPGYVCPCVGQVSLSPESQQVLLDTYYDDAVAGDLGAISALSIVNWGATPVAPSSIAEGVDPALVEPLIGGALEGRLGAVAGLTAAVSGARAEGRGATSPVSLDGIDPALVDSLVEGALEGRLGAVAGLSVLSAEGGAEGIGLDSENIDSLPAMIHSFPQLVSLFTRELTETYAGDVSKAIRGLRGGLLARVSPNLKQEIEDHIIKLLESGGGIDDLKELRQIMSLVAVLGLNIGRDLLWDVKQAIKEFIEVSFGEMDLESFLDFLELVRAIVGPVLGEAVVEESSLVPDFVLTQLDSGAFVGEDGSLGNSQVELDGIAPDGSDVDPTAVQDESDESAVPSITPVDLHSLRAANLGGRHAIQSGDVAGDGVSLGIDSTQALDQRTDSDSGDDRGREGDAQFNFVNTLEEAVVTGFETTAIQMLDFINQLLISNLDPSLDDILNQLDLSNVNLDDL